MEQTFVAQYGIQFLFFSSLESQPIYQMNFPIFFRSVNCSGDQNFKNIGKKKKATWHPAALKELKS